MRLADLTGKATEWLRPDGPGGDVVISSRVRLARNLAGMPFLSRCTAAQQTELEQRLRSHVTADDVLGKGFYVDLVAAGELDRQLLVERHLISHPMAEATCPRGVAIAADETLAIMINEEDHIRMQALRNGLQLEAAMEQIHHIDDTLEQRLDWAFHSRYGYLTACPTNVGTGLRVSVMLHLPALRLTGELQKAVNAARDMNLAFRGLHGEGTEATGDFFQLSNQVTLGKTEQQIVEAFTNDILPGFINYELQAREALANGPETTGLDDKIFRSLALLRAARMISSEEVIYLLSLVRLGVNLRRITDVSLEAINELFLLTQPAHLQRFTHRQMDPPERAAARAEFVQKRLNG
ncbi:MAG: protein arginine kinase [Planctomycetota bacterium]|jgi:protein arginine kinase